VAIAPFVNIGASPENEYLARGIEETITTDLSQFPELAVMRLRGDGNRDADSDIYHYVLDGGILRSGDRLRIDIRLANSGTGEILWSHRYDRPFSDLLRIEDEIHATLVKTLAIKVTEAEKKSRARGYTSSVDAYDLFLRAQQALLPRDRASNEAARTLYREAIEHDPRFARAYAGLALTYAAEYRNRWTDDRSGALENALHLAETALEISPDLPEQHWVIAYVRTQQRRHDLAEASLRDALALNPGYADAYALMGGIQTYAGRPEKTIGFIRQAMRLRPGAGYLYFVLLGRAYYFLGDCGQAEINLNEALARNPANLEARLYRVACAVRRGDVDGAEWEVDEIDTLLPGFAIDNWLSTYPMTADHQLSALKRDLRAAGLR
jgi:TolB-like protein